MAVALDTENELMSTLANRRSEFRNSFKLKPLNKTEETDENGSFITSSSLGTLQETDLLASLKERRLKRKTLLPPIGQSLSTTEELKQPERQENDDPAAVGNNMRKLRALRNRIRETRFDSVQVPTEHYSSLPDTAPAPIITQQSSHRWRMLSTQLGSNTERKTIEQESFDFFTGQIDDVPDESQAVLAETEEMVDAEENDGEEPDTNEEREGSTLLDHHQEVQEGDPASYATCEYNLPTYVPYRSRVAMEQELYFIPASTPVPPEYKTPGNAPPVFAEESGMYLGDRPKVSPSNQAIMENRLLKQSDQDTHWFGSDGLLKVQRDPLSPLVTRPLLLGYEENTQVVYKQLPMLAAHAYNNYLVQSKKRYLILSRSDNYKGYHRSVSGHYELVFHIGQLKFKHHPLFSPEHVLASDLIEQYQQHQSLDRHKIADHLRQKLHAMEYTTHNIRQSLASTMSQNDLETVNEMQSQLARYLTEMRDIRQQLKQVEFTEYKLVRSIAETWKEIKALRLRQEYSCTNVQITMHKTVPDVHQDEINWEKDIQSELEDQRAEFETANHQKVQMYEAQMSQWKDYERKRRRAQRQLEGRASSQAEGSGLDTTEQLDSESVISIPPEKPRPVAPPTFNDEERRIAILEMYRQQCRKPGEPILIPQLTFNHPITQQCPREEQLRRNEVSATRYRLKILYNDKEICSTRDSVLNPDFSVNFDEQLRAEVIEHPQAIKFQVVYYSLLLPSVLAQVFVPIPDTSTELESYQFCATHTVEYSTHNGVGSGQTHPLLPRHGVLVTGGVISASVGWGEGSDGEPLSPVKQKQQLGITAINSVPKIKKWIEEARLDPNDPRNFELLDLAKSCSTDDADYFRLQSIDDIERFVSDEEFTGDKRFTLLQLREQGHPALKGKSIPLNEESITESIWKTVQDYKPFALSELPVTIFGNFYDKQKEEREKYLNEIRRTVLNRTGKRFHNKLTLEDVIHEELIPNIGSLKNSVLQLLSPHRPLKPKRKPYHKPKPQNTHVDECHLSIRIVRAINTPVRDKAAGTTTLQHDIEQTEVLVRPFVEVSFGNEKQRTTIGHGPHPHWNEEIVLPFHPPHDDFSPFALQKVTDELRCDLYDETTTDLLQDERQRQTDLHQRIERKWLGVLAVPFSTLNARPKIEGTFQMTTPPVSLGYHYPATSVDTEGVYIQLFITVEPALGLPPPISEKFDSLEDSQLLFKASMWLKTIRETFPSRNYQSTAIDSSGRYVFLTRFIHSQNPPTEIYTPPAAPAAEDSDGTTHPPLTGQRLMQCMEKLAWFVSLIPSLPDSILFSGTCDVWTTTEQFLRMLGGDEEEHAVLLCNYFLHVGQQQAWVVLGHAIPEGPTAYVLTSNPLGYGKTFILWDPSSGRHFATTQSYIPLISIGTVFNDHNIWANNQEWEHPGQMTFDFDNLRNWIPVFPPATAAQLLPTIQVETLNYSQTNSDQVEGLQTRIDTMIRSHIGSLRVRHLTRWNKSCSRKIQGVLHKFEETPFGANPDHKQDMIDMFPRYQIHGYPLNLRCSNTKELMEAIEHTGIHLCEHDRVEFGLGVYIHPYPNNILSVWVYLMSLIPNP